MQGHFIGRVPGSTRNYFVHSTFRSRWYRRHGRRLRAVNEQELQAYLRQCPERKGCFPLSRLELEPGTIDTPTAEAPAQGEITPPPAAAAPRRKRRTRKKKDVA